jgi:hypothetical protein
VRAANILNRAYFDAATLERMLTNLRGRLRPDGLLIVCRTSDAGINNASVFTLEEDGSFRTLATLNEGSEVAGIVTSMPAIKRTRSEDRSGSSYPLGSFPQTPL